MKLVVTCPALYPSRDRIHFLDDSARRFGIELRPHGLGQQFVDWRHMLMEHTLPAFRQYVAEGATHVLYVDGCDSLFVNTLDEIVKRYAAYGMPRMLVSADEGQSWLNAGGYVGELDFIIPTWESLYERYGAGDGDYQNWLIHGYENLGPRIRLDKDYLIFQPIDDVNEAIAWGALPDGCNKPCVLHFRGGYSDPVTGRDERMRPVIEELWG